MMAETEDLQAWVGREESTEDDLIRRPAMLMRSIIPTAEDLVEGSPLPPLWSWLYFPVAAPLDQLGPDGHPARGGFLPPVTLPRRMWAGGRLRFPGDLNIGDHAVKRSRILKVAPKTGKSGALCFVTVEHVISVRGAPCVIEEHDIVYREAAGPGEGPPPPRGATLAGDVRERVTPGSVMLFRYSAVTFNGHRIHYDRDYCTTVEGYPGLVVHGPLIATQLADLAVRRSGRPLASFSFRAVSPLFDTAPYDIVAAAEGDVWKLEAQTLDGHLAMEAEARLC